MKGYLIAGLLRNLLGIGLLTLLDHNGLPLTLALFLVVLCGFFLYVVQVKLFIGNVSIIAVGGMFAVMFVANRMLLGIVHEHFGLALYWAQGLSVLVLSTSTWLVLKLYHRHRESRQ